MRGYKYDTSCKITLFLTNKIGLKSVCPDTNNEKNWACMLVLLFKENRQTEAWYLLVAAFLFTVHIFI